MKWIKRIVIVAVLIALALAGGIYFWLNSSKPQYSGELKITGVDQPVTTYFDEYGIPHIYAENKHDLYLTFGYLHAQDRLFQMEMMRRVGSGRMAEIAGRPMLQMDKLFRSIGLVEYAQESAAYIETLKNTPMYDDISAYLAGINEFITHGKTPPEFVLMGIEKQLFTVEDIFYITGAMSFNFSMAQRTEPVIDHIYRHFGDKYLYDLGVWHDSSESYIPTNNFQPFSLKRKSPLRESSGGSAAILQKDSVSIALARAMSEIEALLPVFPLQGSNAWVLSGDKTSSGEVLFCNDTHIGYMLPQTWYEAHLHTSEFEIYGHFMAGVPFSLVGRNKQLSWGLTMLLNDDMDFYYEQTDEKNRDLFLYDNQYEKASVRTYTIKIKDESDTTVQVRYTRHGPIVNDVFSGMENKQPISMYWTYTQLPNRTVDAFYGMNNATDFISFEKNVSLIHAPGLNVNYGDVDGNVAWWGCASLIERNDSVNSLTILDGSDSKSNPIGFYPFEVNPKCINPEWGYIYSANDWPQALHISQSDSTKTLWYPGYYKPQYRADRIRKLIETRNDWDMESIQAVTTDYTSDSDAEIMHLWWKELSTVKEFRDSSAFRKFDFLFDWNGEYAPIRPEPTFYNKMLYHYLRLTLNDELGDELFGLFMKTHHVQRSHTFLYRQKNSPWWDDVHTEPVETRADIIYQAFQISVKELTTQFGNNPKIWNWRKACTLELNHPLGAISFLKPIFSLSAQPVFGGNETIAQSGFLVDSTGIYKVFFGPQMRIIVDFSNSDGGLNITPSGNSGHVMSKYYADQAKLYRNLKFRPQTMNKTVIEKYPSLVISGG